VSDTTSDCLEWRGRSTLYNPLHYRPFERSPKWRVFFKITSCSARATQTAPEDRELKQEVVAPRWRRIFAGRSVRCSREGCLQEREPRQSTRFLSGHEVREQWRLRRGSRRAVGTARQQSGL